MVWAALFYPSVRSWKGNTGTGKNSAGGYAGRIKPSWIDSSTWPAFHVQAGGYASRPWPLETILVSILIEQEKALADLRVKVKGLEDAVRGQKEADVDRLE